MRKRVLGRSRRFEAPVTRATVQLRGPPPSGAAGSADGGRGMRIGCERQTEPGLSRSNLSKRHT
jgi:hypothetical protein